MALSNLYDPEKLAVSGHWVTEGTDERRLLESHPALKVGLEAMIQAHQILLTTVRTLGTAEELVTLLTQQITDDDGVFDSKARGTHHTMSAGIEFWAAVPERAARFVTARDLLFPQGLNIVRTSYRNQIGVTRQVRERLDARTKAFLATIVFEERTVLDEVNAWFDAADRLSKALAERAKLTGTDDDAVTRGDVRNARNAWIQATRDLLELARISRLTPQQQHTLFADLRDAEQRAMRRVRNDGGHTQPEVPELPALPEAPATPAPKDELEEQI